MYEAECRRRTRYIHVDQETDDEIAKKINEVASQVSDCISDPVQFFSEVCKLPRENRWKGRFISENRWKGRFINVVKRYAKKRDRESSNITKWWRSACRGSCTIYIRG